MAELVTIYMPTRNRRTLVERAVASVLGQTHEAIELIVVNDASSDGTRDYLEALAAGDSRVQCVHMDRPGGAPAARNLAIRKARGQFITGLDDDDEFDPQRIETFLTHWHALGPATRSVSCLFSECMMTDGETVTATADRGDNVTYTDLFRHNIIGNQVFCPTERLLAIDGFDEGLPAWQDLETFMRLVRQYGAARLVPLPTYICHVERARDRISAKPDKLRAAFEKIIEKHRAVPDALKHQLFLQIFSSFYGIHPTLRDWKRMIAWRAKPDLLVRLLRANLRHSIRART